MENPGSSRACAFGRGKYPFSSQDRSSRINGGESSLEVTPGFGPAAELVA